MRRFFTPVLQICLGMLCFTLSLIFIAYAFGLIPDENKNALRARAQVSEALAIQLAGAASRNDVAAIKETISAVVARSGGDVLSVAMRRASGEILVEAGNHNARWVAPSGDRSTETHVQIPLKNGKADWGTIEISYRQLPNSQYALGFSKDIVLLLAFVGIGGFAGFYFILKRSLRELDPGRVIPERVQAAFDALAEGVLIMDETGRLLLANKAFANKLGATSASLFGAKIDELPWLQFNDRFVSDELPWRVAMRVEQPVTGSFMGVRDASGAHRKMIVNATRIADGKKTRGVIATFDDVTLLQEKNEQLESSIEQLNSFQRKIEQQNHDLQFLASCDPLTGCLNRRAFFAEVERLFDKASPPRSVLMLDLDHFKSINDRFGHAVGDEVLAGFASILKNACRDQGIVGRYGGEEFCIAVAEFPEQHVADLAERICRTLRETKTLLPNGDPVTVSVGIASVVDGSRSILDLMKQADAALYAAKSTGRNRAVNWNAMPAQGTQTADQPIVTRSHERVLGKDSMSASISHTEITATPESEIAREHVEAIIRRYGDRKRFAMAHIVLDGFNYLRAGSFDNGANPLLDKVGERISRHLRDDDMLARVGRDQFYVLLDPIDDKKSVQLILDEIAGEFRRPLFLHGVEVLGSASIGVSVYPDDGSTYDVLRSNADSAMRQAREIERGGFCFFDPGMIVAANARAKAEQQLRLAVRDRLFCCAFQPKIDISNDEVIGFEALVRWRIGRDEYRSPGEFIGLAIELNLIDQITIMVIENVIESFDQIDTGFGSSATVSINIAAKQANDAQFMYTIVQMLRESGRAQRIILELTEESFISKGAFQSEILPALQQMGVRISIDDFGTGYSSLGALADIAVDEIKIDRSFITEIHKRPRNQSVLKAINLLGDALGLTIVAEGVETYEELLYLRAATSIRYVQGFYFSKPFYIDAPADTGHRFSINRSRESSRTLTSARAV